MLEIIILLNCRGKYYASVHLIEKTLSRKKYKPITIRRMAFWETEKSYYLR